MTFQFEFNFCKSVARTTFLALCFFALLAMPTFAEKGARCIVARDGTRVPLVKSTTQVGVILHPGVSTKDFASRIKSGAVGVLSSDSERSNVRIKILNVAALSATHRQLIRDDVAVDDVRDVYYFEGHTEPIISSHNIVVRVNPGLLDVQLAQLWDDYSVDVVKHHAAGLDHVYLVTPRYGVMDEVLRAEVLAIDQRTVWAQPDFITKLEHHQAAAASDEFFSKQWHLENLGTEFGIFDADIDITEAWAVTLGEDILFGMFDDACDVEHEDLAPNYIGVGNDITLPGDTIGADDPRPKALGDNHGTSVMGLAVARANAVGVRGVAPAARFTVSRGRGGARETSELIAGAFTFARQQSVDVHINGWGLPPGFAIVPAVIEDAIEKAFNDGRDLDGADGVQRPRGMVVVFSSGDGIGGVGRNLAFRAFLSTLPTVIGVGASNALDQLTTYSDFGPEINFVAPGGDANGFITTTDNDDLAVDPGQNVGGFIAETDSLDIEPSGLYHGGFSGTSASCPIAAGVAALVLSVNAELTATDVRLILEHTTDKISPNDAVYHGITSRSLRYGYGRINAKNAVKAAQDSQTNGRLTWPERVGGVSVSNSQLLWRQNGDRLEFRVLEERANTQDDPETIASELRTTDEFLILVSDEPFAFIPVDGECYSNLQLGCVSSQLTALPDGVTIHSDANQTGVGCGFSCIAEGTSDCEANSVHCMNFDSTSGKKYFAIYARNTLGRYSFGVAVDSDGDVTDEAFILGANTGTTPGANPVDVGPKISIRVSPRLGLSPLAVRFQGNAISEFPIDDARTMWDFDVDDDVVVNTTSRISTFTYVVDAGDTKTFTARLTMFDVNGNIGFAQTTITVTGADADEATGGTSDAGEISVRIPGATGSDVDSGISPFNVELSVNTSGLPGTLQTISWDLGDGSSANSLFVTHTYVNETASDLRLPITARVTTITSGSTILTTTLSRTITVLPGAGIDAGPGEIPILPGAGASGAGGSATPCGVISMLPLFVMIFTLAGYRRFRS